MKKYLPIIHYENKTFLRVKGANATETKYFGLNSCYILSTQFIGTKILQIDTRMQVSDSQLVSFSNNGTYNMHIHFHVFWYH